ncbi:MAG: hypothetical protein RLZZ76_394 [Candidatus Parcubacteria bacterium]|jgi:hypothetical protein
MLIIFEPFTSFWMVWMVVMFLLACLFMQKRQLQNVARFFTLATFDLSAEKINKTIILTYLVLMLLLIFSL